MGFIKLSELLGKLPKPKAFVFDFDGTITAKGVYHPSEEMVSALVRLAKIMPIACCTGRQLASFEEHGLEFLIEGMGASEREQFLRNMYVLGENGAIGYAYNPNSSHYEEFYRADWPEDFIPREQFFSEVSKEVEDLGYPYYDAHKVVVVFRTKLHAEGDSKIEEIYKLSDQIYQRIINYLERYNKNFRQYLHVGNSGLGVIVGPVDGNKDRGIIELANYLEREKGINFSPAAREVFIVGDRPEPSGNDTALLSGRYGTPFNVGEEYLAKNKPADFTALNSVCDADGVRITNSAGTLMLINEICSTSPHSSCVG